MHALSAMLHCRSWLFGLCLVWLQPVFADTSTTCPTQGIAVQVLGSGGPELTDARASSAYLIWHDGRARVLVDMGGGSLLRFEQSGARMEDIDFILLTHLHVDHSADLPYLIKASFFTGRSRDLPLYGPTGNERMPATTDFVRTLFGPQGAFRYLSDYLDGTAAYTLRPHDVQAEGTARRTVLNDSTYRIEAVPVHHGPIPALAWRVNLAGRSVVFSGDMNNSNDTLAGLAAGADVLVAHHAIPEDAGAVARNLHMPPSVIGDIAARAKVKRLLLSHRMQRTIGRESESQKLIEKHYNGPILFVEDRQCFPVP